MSPTRFVFALGASAAMLAAAGAQFGQPGGQPGGFPGGAKAAPTPLTANLLPYVGDENFRKELRLSDEQAKKLLAFRQKVWDETYTTAARDVKIDERNKATEAEIKAVLDADQLKRATQLAAQIAWGAERLGGFGPGESVVLSQKLDLRTISPTVLTKHPEIAAVLKLDDTQKKLAQGPRGFGTTDVYLTAEQAAAARAFVGESPKDALRAQRDPRTRGLDGGAGFPTRLRIPPRVNYLLAADVQKELKLTEEQVKAATDLRPRYMPGRPDTTLSPAATKKANDAVLFEAEAEVAKILTTDQRKRLDQIVRQQQPHWEFDEAGELGKAIGVTADQRKAEAAAAEVHAAAVVKAVASGEPLEKVRAAADAAEVAYYNTAAKILTADQLAKKQDWLGLPFKGSVRPPPYPNSPPGGFDRPPPAGNNPGPPAVRKLTFGRYFSELTTVANYPGVRAELKLTEEQAKKVSEAAAALSEKFPTRELLSANQGADKGDKFMADRSAFIEKALGGILTKEQRARLGELMIQQAEGPRTGPGGGTVAAPSLPGVAEAIKLTDDQKKKYLDGAAAAEVLTDDQKKAIKEMAGKAVDIEVVFARRGPGGGPGGDGPGPISGPPRAALPHTVTLARSTVFWDAIKVAPEQVNKLAAAFNEYTLATGGARRAADDRADAVAAVTKAVEATLTANQRARLEQLDLQQSAANDLVSALLGTPRNPAAVRKELAITDEQAKAIREADQEFEQLAGMLDAVEHDAASEPRKEVRELRLKLRDRLDAKIEGLLTAEQRAKWKSMLGEPYAGFTKQPLHGGRFGGAAGGLGGGAGGAGGFEP